MTYNQQIYKYITTFLEQIADQCQYSFHVFKGHLLISVFAMLMVSIQCRDGTPTAVSPPPNSPQYTCNNGISSTEKASTNKEKCVSCHSDYVLKKSDETCAVVKVITFAGGNAGGNTATECGTTTPATGGESCKDGTSIDAQFKNPTGVAVDSNDNVYVADADNNRIRKIIIPR